MLSSDSLKNKLVELEQELIDKIKVKALTYNLSGSNRFRSNDAAKHLEKLVNFLDPREKDDRNKSTPYFQRLITYVSSLCGDLTQANFEAVFAEQAVNDEIDALFQSPKNVAEYYVDKTHFGFEWQGKSYNFDNVLRLLLKINFLKAAVRKEELSDEWKNQQLATLQQQVTDFVNDQGRNVVSVEEVNAEEQYRLQPDDTLDRDNFFGYAFINLDTMWPAYWDAYWPVSSGGFREDPSLFPLQMQHAHVYPWHERALYFLVGGDVRKYFKDQWRVFKVGFEAFKGIMSQYYNDDDQPYNLVAMALFALPLLAMLFCDIPTALVKGILGLPFRLLRGLINAVCDEGSPAWTDSTDLVNKAENILIFALFFTMRIPLVLATFFGGLFLGGPLLSMAVGVVAAFAKYIVKPIISCFSPDVPEVVVDLAPQQADAEPAPAPSNTQQLMRQLMRAQQRLGEQNDQLVIGDHVLSKHEIIKDLDLLRRNQPVRNINWLLEVKDFSAASPVRLFSLPGLPVQAPADLPAHANDAVVPASSAQY